MEKTNLQMEKMNLQMEKVNLHMEKDNLHMEKDNLHMEKTNLHMEKDNLHMEKCNLHVEKCNLHVEKCNLQVKIEKSEKKCHSERNERERMESKNLLILDVSTSLRFAQHDKRHGQNYENNFQNIQKVLYT